MRNKAIHFCSYLFLFLSMLCMLISCHRPTPTTPLNQLKIQIVYHKKHILQGINVNAVDGTKEFIFINTDRRKPITVQFPPLEIYETTSNSLRKLPEGEWPEFAKKTHSITIPPGGRHILTTPFCMSVVKSFIRRRPPVLHFLFDTSNIETEEDNNVFKGTVVSDSVWDDSQIRTVE